MKTKSKKHGVFETMLRWSGIFIGLALSVGAVSLAQAAEEIVEWDRTVLPIQQKPFAGHVALRTSESELDFPAEVSAPKRAPNILLIMPDDVGFGASTAFGGPVPTPALGSRRGSLQPIPYHGTLLANAICASYRS